MTSVDEATSAPRDRLDLDALSEASRAAIDAYFEHGAGSGSTVRLNEAAWQRLAIVPRMFRDVRRVDTSWSLFGVPLAAPVLAAPSAGHGLLHHDGEIETARGVRAASAMLVLAQGSSVRIEDVAAHAGPYIQQIYLPKKRDLLLDFLDRAVAAGAVALALTVDQPAVGNAYGFRAGLAAALGERHGWGASENFPQARREDLATDAAVGLEEIAWLARRSGLPVLVKGLLHPEDARLALDAGAAGIIVSNHGGRQIDGSITTAEALASIAEVIRGRRPLLVDGGIRSGEDVLRALALGADGVLVGRPVVRGLRAGGASGVAAALTTLQHGFATVMAMAGAARLEEITPALVRERPVALLPDPWGGAR